LGPLLFLRHVHVIWRNVESTVKLFTVSCIVYRKIRNDSDIDTLQIDLFKLREWAVENIMKINAGTSKADSFMRAQVKDPLNYFLGAKEFRKRVAENI
jgi:hypothetical protein